MSSITYNLKDFQTLKTDLFQKDFLLTWEHPEEEIKAILTLADTFKRLHQAGQVLQVLRHRTRHLDLPGQLHPHPVQLRLAPPTPWAWACPTWTSRRARWPTARPCARPPT